MFHLEHQKSNQTIYDSIWSDSKQYGGMIWLEEEAALHLLLASSLSLSTIIIDDYLNDLFLKKCLIKLITLSPLNDSYRRLWSEI